MKPLPFLTAALVLVLSLIKAPGCGQDTTPVKGPPPRFVQYYAGELFLTEKTRLENGDSSRLRSRLDSLRRRYEITLAERDSIVSWYRDSLPRWEAFLREVLASLDSVARTGRTAPSVTIGGREEDDEEEEKEEQETDPGRDPE